MHRLQRTIRAVGNKNVCNKTCQLFEIVSFDSSRNYIETLKLNKQKKCSETPRKTLKCRTFPQVTQTASCEAHKAGEPLPLPPSVPSQYFINKVRNNSNCSTQQKDSSVAPSNQTCGFTFALVI